MGFFLNPAALRHSLVVTPHKGIPKTFTTTTTRVPAAPVPETSSSRDRGKEQLSHLFTVVYPKSLVEGPPRGAIAAPVSVTAGLNARHNANEARVAADRCPVHATPARTEYCESASHAADVALDAYHEAVLTGIDEDGTLQDVVDLSLAADNACAIDSGDRAE